MNVRDVLINLGYQLTESGSNFHTAAIYRNGDNKTALSISKETGIWYDFVEGKGGNFKQLINKTLNNAETDNLIKGIELNNTPKDIKLKHIASINEYDTIDFLEDFSYWSARNISRETLRLFPGGIVSSGSLKNRYVFIIKNSLGKIVGLTGRDITGKAHVKWKHRGKTSNWVYPLQINKKDILSKSEIIIVESIGDMLSLYEAGISNVLVSFGIRLSRHALMTILKLNPNKVIIALNNDKNLAGNIGAENMRKSLSSFINKSKIIVKTIENYNDWNDMLIAEGKKNIQKAFE